MKCIFANKTIALVEFSQGPKTLLWPVSGEECQITPLLPCQPVVWQASGPVPRPVIRKVSGTKPLVAWQTVCLPGPCVFSSRSLGKYLDFRNCKYVSQSVRRPARPLLPQPRWCQLCRLLILVACQLLCSPNTRSSPRLIFGQVCGSLPPQGCRLVSPLRVSLYHRQ